MAQEGSRGHQRAVEASTDHALAPATITNPIGSPRESSDVGSRTATVGVAKAGLAAAAGDKAAKKPHHLITEQKRRKRETEMYSGLRSLLPHVPETAGRLATVTEAIRFVEHLEGSLANLKKLKQERALAQRAAAADLGAGGSSPAPPYASPSLPKKKQQHQPEVEAAPPRIELRTGLDTNDAYMVVCVPRQRPGVLVTVVSVLEKHHIGVITAHVASDEARTRFTVHTRVNVEAIKKLDAEPPSSEAIYQLALSEIVARLSS